MIMTYLKTIGTFTHLNYKTFVSQELEIYCIAHLRDLHVHIFSNYSSITVVTGMLCKNVSILNALFHADCIFTGV